MELHVVVGVASPGGHRDLAAVNSSDEGGRIQVWAGLGGLNQQGVARYFVGGDQVSLRVIQGVGTIGVDDTVPLSPFEMSV